MNEFHPASQDGCRRLTSGSPHNYLDWRPGSGNTVEIFDIHVRPQDRRHGHGKLMVIKLIRECTSRGAATVYAITRASNFMAQEFYESMKFRAVPLRGFYKDEPLASGRPYTDAIMYVWDVGSLV